MSERGGLRTRPGYFPILHKSLKYRRESSPNDRGRETCSQPPLDQTGFPLISLKARRRSGEETSCARSLISSCLDAGQGRGRSCDELFS